MRKIKSLVTRNRKTKITAALLALLAIAGTAVAFYLALVGGAGTGTQALAGPPTASDVALTATWPEAQLTPGTIGQPVDIVVHNPNASPVQFDGHNLHATFTTDVSGCLPAWFSYSNDSGNFLTPIPVGASATVDLGNVGHVFFNETSPPSDQSVCETAHLTLHLTTH